MTKTRGDKVTVWAYKFFFTDTAEVIQPKSWEMGREKEMTGDWGETDVKQ